MQILWLNANLLLPLDKGGKLRTWHLLRNLARRHEVTYLSFADPAQPASLVEGMREVAAVVETVPRSDSGKDGVRFYLDVARRLADPLPYAAAKYRSRAYRERLHAILARQRFDLVVCDFLVPAVNLPDTLPCPSVVFTHNVESEIWRRHAEAELRPVRRRLLLGQHARMLLFERKTLARFDLALTVSEADSDTIRRLYPEVRVPLRVVPTGVDVDYFAPGTAEPDAGRLVFTGSMDWLPNEDAMLYFARQILPKVRASVPEARLSIVGRAPTAAVRRLGREDGIEVTGAVDDVRPWVERASVFVVPLRIGGGTRLKIFEAMAMGKAVVSTAIGAEGLGVENGRDIVIADDPNDFAAAVKGLAMSREKREEIGRAARELMVSRYDWTAVSSDLEQALVAAASRSPGAVVPARFEPGRHRARERAGKAPTRLTGTG